MGVPVPFCSLTLCPVSWRARRVHVVPPAPFQPVLRVRGGTDSAGFVRVARPSPSRQSQPAHPSLTRRNCEEVAVSSPRANVARAESEPGGGRQRARLDPGSAGAVTPRGASVSTAFRTPPEHLPPVFIEPRDDVEEARRAASATVLVEANSSQRSAARQPRRPDKVDRTATDTSVHLLRVGRGA